MIATTTTQLNLDGAAAKASDPADCEVRLVICCIKVSSACVFELIVTASRARGNDSVDRHDRRVNDMAERAVFTPSSWKYPGGFRCRR